MSDPRFKPPESNVVVASTQASGPPRQMRGKLALATLIQFALLCTGAMGALLEMTSVAMLNVPGLIALVAGLVCLYGGVALLVVTRVRGRAWLSASILLQLTSMVAWHAFYLGSGPAHRTATVLLPLVFGLVLAIAGRLMPLAWLAANGEIK